MLVLASPVSMSPWARPVYGGGLYLYGHDSRVSTDQNFKCRLSVGFGFTLQLARIGTFRVQYIHFSALQVLSYFLPHHNLVDAMETKMQIGVVQCFVSVGRCCLARHNCYSHSI